MSGCLVLVGTPIGHLDDLSPRAAAALRTADRVLCEDTRRTRPLLVRIGATARPTAYHEHNERQKLAQVLGWLDAGETVALVSDAGMPLVSDPGFPLVQAALAAGHAVEAVPGPVAAVLALALSGLPPLPFAVFGFLPPKAGKRAAAAAEIASWPHTSVLYLSPHRGAAELAALAAACGDRPAALCRELTKRHEEVRRASLRELAAQVAADPPKGEWTLAIGPPAAAPHATEASDAADFDALASTARRRAAAEGMPLKAAAFAVATEAGLPRRALYRHMLSGGGEDDA